MRVLSVIILILFTLPLYACSNVKDLKFTADNRDEIIEKVKKSKDLTAEEVGLLTVALTRYSLSEVIGDKQTIEGKTVGELIEEQRTIIAEAEAMAAEERRKAAEEKKRHDQLIATMKSTLVVSVIGKRFEDSDYRAYRYNSEQLLDIVSENKGGKTLRAYKGKLIFND